MIRTFTVIGGGSAYTPGLVAALLHAREALPLEEVRLYDIDARHLEIVATLTAKMAGARNASFSVVPVSDLAEAVKGTDVVLNSSRPGGFEARRMDETLPLEFGIPGQETVGPGGFFFALRSVPAAVELAAVMKRLAPDALLLNYTNPTNIVTQALCPTGVKVLGLCDQSDEDLENLAGALGRSGSWTFDCVGLNHATWYRDVRIADAPLPDVEEIETPRWLSGEYRLRFEISRELAKAQAGYWPNSYLAYYAKPQEFVKQARADGVRTDAILKKLPLFFQHFEEEGAKVQPDLKHHRGTEGFGDMAVRVLRAVGSTDAESIVLNVPSHGAASPFASSTVVELRCDVSAVEVVRRSAPALPAEQEPLLRALERYQAAAAEAARGHDVGLALEALRANPLIPSREAASEMFEAAKKLYGKRVPLFE